MSRRGQQGYQQYRTRDRWEDDESSSSAYEGRHMSPYRGDNRRPNPHQNNHSNNGYSSDPGSLGSAEDGPTYVLEHLATFRVSPEAGLVYPSDGMRRLLHMEKTTGIWTQKMLLKLERKWVFILSHENGDVVEKFPMELIREPTAFTSQDPKELYNNIFIFVVAEDTKRKHDNPTEMHIFQCLRISAKDVVEDVKLYMSGKTISGGAMRGGIRGEDIPPPPEEPAPEPPLISNGFRDFSDPEVRGDLRGGGPRSERSSVSHNDEVSSTSSERYERDVAILNNCFDDIERFIARLQHTAAATRELERRRRSRKSKKKDIGDGLLSMRAKPPPEREFIDIFQKFKLSFNLLAKLRSHIRDPNAPELVHFLFTPLALIVDASRDSYFESSLPPKVISPLLSQESIELLTNCLSSRETELWHSLGNAWLIPRETWKYPVQPYRPVFYSGWAPEVTDDMRDRRPTIFPDRTEGELRRSLREDYDFYDSDRKESSPLPSELGGHNRYRNPPPPRAEERPRSMTPMSSEYQQDGSMESQIFEKNQKKWLDEMKSRDAKIVQVTYPRTANNEKELTVVRGEYLEVVDDSRKWWKAMNSRGVTAHVPHTIVTPCTFEDSLEFRRTQPGRLVAKKDISYEESNASFNRSCIPTPPPLPSLPSNSPTLKGSGSTTISRQPITPSNSGQAFDRISCTSHSQNSLLMNEELKIVLEGLKRTKRNLDIVKTPDVFITQTSSPKEVENWLRMKAFSEEICSKFRGKSGGQLFAFSKKDLETICGKIEGARLDSQLTIQRNVSGYKTVRTSELNHVLAEQRKRVDWGADPPTGQATQKQKSKFYLESDEQQQNVAENFQFLLQYDADEIRDNNSKCSSDESQSPRSLKGEIKRQKEKMGKQSIIINDSTFC